MATSWTTSPARTQPAPGPLPPPEEPPGAPLTAPAPAAAVGADPQVERLVEAALPAMQDLLDLALLADPAQLKLLCEAQTRRVASERGSTGMSPVLLEQAARRLQARITGLDFLDDLMLSGEYTDIKINSDGTVWTRSKGDTHFAAQTQLRPDPTQVQRMVTALLAATSRACTEATPSVDAKLPRGGPYGGARIKVLNPTICGGIYHHIDLRLFEPRPVSPAQIVQEWHMCPEGVMERLLDAVRGERRILVAGGTGTGKTTLLSAMLSALPRNATLVKIEDPEEIWVDLPNVETLERRERPDGSEVSPYETDDAVNDAMRMSPSHLVVGEVRTGQAARALLRALMSDHSGATTFHASSPYEVMERLSVLMEDDCGSSPKAVRKMLMWALDLIVQIGFRDGVRRVVGMYELRHPLETAERGLPDIQALWVQGDDPDSIPNFRRPLRGAAFG